MWSRTAGIGAVTLVACAAIGCAAPSADTDAPAKQAGGAVAAIVGGQPISMEEVDAQGAQADPKTYQALYDTRSNVVQGLIAKALVEAEAAKLELTPEQFVQGEVDEKITEPTDEAITAFFEEKKAEFGGRSMNEMKPYIANFMKREQTNQLRRSLLKRLREAAGVELMLEPPRAEVAVAANDPTKGPENAPIQISTFSEFQ